MSFGVNVTYRVKPGRGQEFLDELSAAGIRDIVLKEEGGIRYDFYLPVEKRDEVLLVECWEKQEDQQRHVKQPHVVHQIREIKERLVDETILVCYEF